MMIAARMQAVFYKLIALAWEVEYIAGIPDGWRVTKFIPSTGVTLPFVSYEKLILGTFLLFWHYPGALHPVQR